MSVNGRLAIHCAVLLFAIAGLFGKWLALSPEMIVAGRTFFSALVLALSISLLSPRSFKISPSKRLWFLITGVLLALHWLLFFYAIQLATIAFALVLFASFPLFTALLEAWLFKQPLTWITALYIIAILAGVYLIVPEFGSETIKYQAVSAGIGSAVTFALLLVANRKLGQQVPAYTIACYQNTVAFLLLVPFVVEHIPSVTASQWSMLILLGVIFTALAHTLMNQALQTLTAIYASVAICLEPIYGVIAAWWLLGEKLTFSALIGVALVLAVNVHASIKRTE